MRLLRLCMLAASLALIAACAVRAIHPRDSGDGIGRIELGVDEAAVEVITLTVTALFTALLWWVARLQHRTHEATLAATKEIERGYAVMWHAPPGLMIDTTRRNPTDAEPDLWLQDVSVTVWIKNFGNTPVEVTAVSLQLTLGDLSGVSPYAEGKRREFRISLVAGRRFKLFQNWPVNSTMVDSVLRGEVNLFLVGYVDYIDKFGVRHRAGYARQYVKSLDVDAWYPASEAATSERNNLAFVTIAGFNYDRPRSKQEGTDW